MCGSGRSNKSSGLTYNLIASKPLVHNCEAQNLSKLALNLNAPELKRTFTNQKLFFQVNRDVSKLIVMFPS